MEKWSRLFYFHFYKTSLSQGGVTAAFSMEVFTSYHSRWTRIMGSQGDIVEDMSKFIHNYFLTGKKTTWNMKTDGHVGGVGIW